MTQTPSRQEAVSRLAELISGIPVAMLTTVTDRGWLRGRPMVAQAGPFDGSLWFLSSRSTSKAGDVRDRQQVNLCYVSAARDRYVSVSGLATLVTDAARVATRWDRSYAEWFPGGASDPDLVWIKVDVEEAEYWDAKAHRMVRLAGFIEPGRTFREIEPGTGI
jgi:general stress protein 26